MSFVKKAVVWLGLNEEYPADDRTRTDASPGERTLTARAHTPVPTNAGHGRAVGRPNGRALESDRPDNGRSSAVGPRPGDEGTVRAIPLAGGSSGGGGASAGPGAGDTGTVRAVPIPKTTKPQVIIPRSFNDAQDVADHFKEANPVIVNMQNADRDLARRLIDFSSGLCYGLGGQMDRVAEQVYLLTPDDVEVSDEERERYAE